jgi:F0F1-type ATP synthase membrane subunit a
MYTSHAIVTVVVKVVHSNLTGLAFGSQHLRQSLLTDAVHTLAYAVAVFQCALVQFHKLVYAPVGSDCDKVSAAEIRVQ